MASQADGTSNIETGERAARARLEVLFEAIDRLTPDELARIGYRAASAREHVALLDAVDEAARRTGRVALVEQARDAVRRAVTARYSAGSFHPTFVAVNWGLSQGTVEDRVAIAETLADAAAATIVEDALDPEVAAALALDAALITNLAGGDVSEGSLARAIREPGNSTARPERRSYRTQLAAAILIGAALVLVTVITDTWTIAAVAVALAAGVRMLIRGARKAG